MIADAACGSARSSSSLISGKYLDRLMLKRLDRPETWLKALIATVLLLVGLYAGYFTWAHIRSVRDAALTRATAEIDLLASLAALEYGRIGQAEPRPAQLQRIIRAIPASVLAQGRTILLADAQ